MFEGPVFMNADFYLERPKSAPKSRLYPARHDLDNLFKLLADSLNKIVFKDDSQIVSATVQKLYGSPERIEFTVGEL